MTGRSLEEPMEEHGINILIVDDEVISGKILRSYLSELGVCEVVTSGQDAVTCVENMLRDKGCTYDLVCLDIDMPVMNGHQALRRIRELEEEHGIHVSDSSRVIMTSSMDDAQNVTQAFMNHCEVYLVKPIKKSDIFEQLTNLGLVEELS